MSAAVILLGLAAIGIFVLAFVLLRVVPASIAAVQVARSSFAALADASLTDEAREKAVQAGSLALLRAFGTILARTVAAAAASWLPVAVADRLGFATSAQVLAFLGRWDVIAGSTVAMTLGYFAYSRSCRKP